MIINQIGSINKAIVEKHIHVVYKLNISILKCNISKSKKKGKDQKSIQSNTTPDPGYQWESDNFTIRHHKREPRGQAFPSR